MSKQQRRPREREGNSLTVKIIDKPETKKNTSASCCDDPSCETENETGSIITPDLSSFVFPLTPSNFIRDFFETSRALAIKCHPSLRDERVSLARQLLHGFNPKLMLANSNSTADGISVWLKNIKSESENEINSIKVKDTDAFACYQAGSCLYFRGTEEIEAAFIPSLLQQLFGFNFAHLYRDNARRGECEVFASHPGHTTTWHCDFQHNFTVQLRGRKKWSLRKHDDISGLDFPYRAVATHFANDDLGKSVLRNQHAIHHLSNINNNNNNNNNNKEDFSLNMVPSDIEETSETVILEAGDVLFHPAGIWHKVETLEGDDGSGSLSINFSLFPLTTGEFIQEALQSLLLTSTCYRRPLTANNNAASASAASASSSSRQTINTQISQALELLQSQLKNLSSEHLFPDVLLEQQQQNQNQKQEESEESTTTTTITSGKFTIPHQVIFDQERKLRVVKPSTTNQNQNQILDSIKKKLSSGSLLLKRNPIATLFELPSDLDNSDSSDEDEEEEEEDDEEDVFEDEEGNVFPTEKKNKDKNKSNKNNNNNNEDEEVFVPDLSSYCCFDLVSNFVSDETNIGNSPSIRIKIRVPNSMKDFLKKTVARIQPESSVRLDSLCSSSKQNNKKNQSFVMNDDLVAFLIYCGFFAIQRSK